MAGIRRVIAYIDGFNLYFGIREKGWKELYWLDVEHLVGTLLKRHQQLVEVKYYTSRIKGPDEKKQRQNAYLDAIGTLQRTSIEYGNYRTKSIECTVCGHTSLIPTEKKTDVKIATAILHDGFENMFDDIILISGDNDLVPPVETVLTHLKGKQVLVAFPPARRTYELGDVATANYVIGKQKLQDSQFPDEIITDAGVVLARPAKWSKPPALEGGPALVSN